MEQATTLTHHLRSKIKSLFAPFAATLYIGLLICIVGASFVDFYGYSLDFSNGSGAIIILGLLSIIVSSILSLVMIYHIWQYILEEFKAEGLDAPVESPGQAIGLLFVPLYNFYWAFIAYGQIPKCLNKLASKRGISNPMPDALGIGVAALMLSGIIPYFGWMLTIIASLILMPMMLFRSTKAITQIPGNTENAALVGNDDAKEKVNLYDTRKFLDLFQYKGIPYNYKLGLLIVAASFLLQLSNQIIMGSFEYMPIRAFLAALAQMIPVVLLAFLQVLLLYKIKNKHILALVFGLITTVFNFTSTLFYTKYIYHLELSSAFTHSMLYNMGSAFVFGVVLIYGFSLGVYLWKFKYVSFMLGKALTNIIPIVGMLISQFSLHGDYKHMILGSIIISVLDVFLGSLAYYMGIQWNIKHISSKN